MCLARQTVHARILIVEADEVGTRSAGRASMGDRDRAAPAVLILTAFSQHDLVEQARDAGPSPTS